MANEQETENAKQFEAWLRENPEKHVELQKVYCREHIIRLSKGTKSFSTMAVGKRIRMYEITQLPFLQVTGDISPRVLDIEKIKNGDQPRSMILRRIEYDGMSVGEVINKIGIAVSSFNRYIRNEPIDVSLTDKIETRLTQFYNPHLNNAQPIVSDSSKTWFKQLQEWLIAHRDDTESICQVTKVYSREALLNFCRGAKDLSSIPQGKSMRLYDITRLEFFKLEGPHPMELDMGKIINREQPRLLLARRIEYDGFNSGTMAKKLGLKIDDVYRYAHDKPTVMSPERKSKIEKAFVDYFSQCSKSQIPQKSASTSLPAQNQSNVVARSVENNQRISGSLVDALADIQTNLAKITKRIENSAGDLQSLLLKEPTLEQRISAVCTAIDVLATQTEYFKDSPEEERKKLANAINVEDWGYIVSVLGRIDQPNSYETFTRLYKRPSNKGRGE